MTLFNCYMKEEHCKLIGIMKKSGFLHDGHECIFWMLITVKPHSSCFNTCSSSRSALQSHEKKTADKIQIF